WGAPGWAAAGRREQPARTAAAATISRRVHGMETIAPAAAPFQDAATNVREASAVDKLFDHEWRLIRVGRSDDIVEVALARPEARNALNGELMEELTEAARLLRLRTDVRAVILTGAETYFS